MEQQKLPNSTVILILGIFAGLLGCCYGFGALLGIVAIILYFGARKIYKENPEGYTGYGNAKTGLVLSILGIVLALVFWGIVIWAINTFGLDVLQDEEKLREALEEWQNG